MVGLLIFGLYESALLLGKLILSDKTRENSTTLTASRLWRELDCGPIAIVLTTVSGEISWRNKKAAEFLGAGRSDSTHSALPANLQSIRAECEGKFRITQLERSGQEALMVFCLCIPGSMGDAYYMIEAPSLGNGIDLLARRECLWNHALESSGHGVWEHDYTRPEGSRDYYSDQWRRMRGLTATQELQPADYDLRNRLHPDDLERVLDMTRQQNSGELKDISIEYRERRPDGSDMWVLARGKVTGFDPQGKPVHIVGTDVDITALKDDEARRATEQEQIYSQHLRLLEEAQRKAEQNAFRESIWRQAVGGAGYGVWSYTVDYSGPKPETNVIFASDEWFHIRGANTSQHELHEMDIWLDRIHPDDREYVEASVNRRLTNEEREVSFEFRELHAQGHWVWILARGTAADFDEQGRPTRIIGIDIDISSVKAEEERRAEEAGRIYRQHLDVLQQSNLIAEEARREAQMLARIDPATGLPNRRKFKERVDELLEEGAYFTIYLIDLDYFKNVNDIHGHAAGDHVLKHSASRLREAIGDDGFVARLGGDEFGAVIVHKDKCCPQRIALTASRIVSSINCPIPMGDLILNVGASLGASSHPADATDYDTLLQHADMALYKVKAGERGRLVMYTAAMGLEKHEKAKLESDLRYAIESEKIVPWFQPIMSSGVAKPDKVEILARWKNGDLDVPPDKFIEVAEHIGMLPQLTASILRQSCEIARHWSDIALSMNITAREACDPATPLRILDTLSKCEFPPHRLEIEITEQALIKDLEAARQVAASLRSVGIKVYIDDFGEGYAGIGYLRDLDIDGIKIDRSCVKDICNNEHAALFLKSLLLMASTLGCKTVAEGIETQDVWLKAVELGCDFGQGYYFSRPLPAKDVPQFMQLSPELVSGRVIAFSRP